MKAMVLEANQEKIKAIAEPYKWAPHLKAMHVLRPCRTRPPMFYTEPLKEQCTRRLLGQLRTDLGTSIYLAAGYCNQLETGTQILGESRQGFATAIEQVVYHAFPAVHKNHVCREPGQVFGSVVRDQGIKQ
jgi:hypothetical protein